MKPIGILILSGVFLITLLSPQTTGLNCFQCSTGEGSDFCYSTFPNPSGCIWPLNNYCTKIVTYANGGIAIARSCNVVSLDNKCIEIGSTKTCSYSCATDACNLSPQLGPNRFLLPSLVSVLFFILFSAFR
uniref:Omega-scoloptoxin n=1 Tax=Hemiscolopendra marginata TaxID=943146 RepID=A0A646QDF6_9MYRI